MAVPLLCSWVIHCLLNNCQESRDCVLALSLHAVQTLPPRKSCMGCDFPLVSFLVCHLSPPVNVFFPHWSADSTLLSDLLWSPWLKFTWHISSNDLKTPHSGGKASLSPSCGVQEIKVQRLNSSQSYSPCQPKKQSGWESGSWNS